MIDVTGTPRVAEGGLTMRSRTIAGLVIVSILALGGCGRTAMPSEVDLLSPLPHLSENELIEMVTGALDVAMVEGLDNTSAGLDAETQSVWFSGPDLAADSDVVQILLDYIADASSGRVHVSVLPYEGGPSFFAVPPGSVPPENAKGSEP